MHTEPASPDMIPSTRPTLAGQLTAIWAVLGFSLLLLQALYRLSPMVQNMLQEPLQWWHWALIALWMSFMGYTEGYKGFQKAFSPRFAARAQWLKHYPGGVLRTLFAPFFCMGFFGATKKRKIVAWALNIGIILLIIVIRQLTQPWRGIVDTGVLLGLTWGLLSVLYYSFQTLIQGKIGVSPEVSELELARQQSTTLKTAAHAAS